MRGDRRAKKSGLLQHGNGGAEVTMGKDFEGFNRKPGEVTNYGSYMGKFTHDCYLFNNNCYLFRFIHLFILFIFLN